MRPATLPVEACQPCCSGRTLGGPGSSQRWTRSRPLRPAAAMYGGQRAQQQQPTPQQPPPAATAAVGRVPAAAPPATRTGAFAASLDYSSSTSPSRSAAAEPSDLLPSGRRRPDTLRTFVEGEQEGQRDGDGLLNPRPRPLKINLDLALYRARQKRLIANSSRQQHDRSRMMREVEESLRSCMALFPEDGRPYVSLGKLFVQQRRFDEALALYEEGCTATGGTNAHLWAAWAYLAAKLGNVSLARKLYDAAIVAAPTHAAAWHGWGLLEKQQGNFLRARDLWLKGIQTLRKTGAPNPYLYQSLAVLAAEMDCVEESRKWFREGTRTVTGRASHALWQAWALMEQKQGDRAVVRALFRRGIEVSPRSRYTHLSWALFEKKEGKVEEARRLFKAGSELNPRDAAILQAWGILEGEQGNVEEARRLLRRASRVDPNHLYVWQAWGCLEYRQQNYEQARELFQQGIWSAPPRAPAVSMVFQAWAMLERDEGNVQLARELLKCAVKADPKSEPSWLVWAQMEEDLGFLQRAAELRSYNMQERVEIVKPTNFSTNGTGASKAGLLAPIFSQISRWFQRYEEASGREGPGMPEFLPVAAERAVVKASAGRGSGGGGR